MSSRQEIRSSEPGRDLVPSISTRRLSRGRVSSEDLEIHQSRSESDNITTNSVVIVLARLLARGLVLMGTGANAPRRCTISGTSNKTLESKSLADDC